MQPLGIKERMFWQLPKMPVREQIVFDSDPTIFKSFPVTPSRVTHPVNMPPKRKNRPEGQMPGPGVRKQLFKDEGRMTESSPAPMETN